MGCHTWYRIPVVTGEQAVKEELYRNLKERRKAKWWDEECELELPQIKDGIERLDEEWLYNATDYHYYVVNGIPGLYKGWEHDPDCPRIGGYPEAIITSYDEMMKAIETGLVGYNDKIYQFAQYSDEEWKSIKESIEKFYNDHPTGIITFG